MITVDQFMDVKSRLANRQSIRGIAQATNLARNTIRKIARAEHPLQKQSARKPRKPRARKIDPFRDYIRSRVEEFNLDACRILPEIRAMGYAGGVHSLRRCIAELKFRSKQLRTATVRFETPPGKQAQCDWGHVGTFVDPSGKRIPIYAFVFVLSYSRQMFVRFTTSMKIPTLIDCHQRAFEFFQGVPQSILYDNMSQVRTGPHRLNSTFADFAEHYGFEVKTHRPYRPRTKGKVERMVSYLKGNFLNGREFAGLDDLNLQCQRWLDETANVRLHRTTGQRPCDLWSQEQSQLVPLDPSRPYTPCLRSSCKVAKDTFIAFQRNRYSVPPDYIGHKVEVQLRGTSLSIWAARAIIAEHAVSASIGESIAHPEHLEKLWHATLSQSPVQGPRHCNVRLDESVQTCDLRLFEEACA